MRNSIITFILLKACLVYTAAHAQEADSIVVYDTVTIEKEPIILKRTVVLPPFKKRSFSPKYLIALSGAISYYIAYNSVCEECKEYYAVTKITNKAALSYATGIELIYLPGVFFVTGRISYSPYREKFHFTDSSNTEFNSINKVTYAEGQLGGGIRVGKDKPVQMLLSAAAKVSFLTNVKGSIPDSSSYRTTVPIEEIHHYRTTIPAIAVSTKFLIQLFYKTYCMPELEYSYDLRSIVDPEGPYTIQRHIPSIRLALVRGF